MSNDMNQEQKLEAAEEIYGKLQANRRRATLSGFMVGEVVFTTPLPRRIKIARLDTKPEFEKEFYRGRGFTDEDLQNGLTAIIETEFKNPEWPSRRYIHEAHLRYYNVSGLGKVMGSDYSEPEKIFESATLEPMHLDAFKTVTQLSMVPRQIVEVFGSYEGFLEVLGRRFDPRGIDWTERTPTQGLYNGGLREFVRALELKSKGELRKLDTANHALGNSLDEMDHFTKLFKILDPSEKRKKEEPPFTPPLFLLAV